MRTSWSALAATVTGLSVDTQLIIVQQPGITGTGIDTSSAFGLFDLTMNATLLQDLRECYGFMDQIRQSFAHC